MSKTVRKFDKFEYFAEDCECVYCEYFISNKRGCSADKCCCSGIFKDALTHGRIKGKHGRNRWED
ncbi:hypothetical protein FACS18949_15930 [Clostridia bacterium]|nr:hypothetical protein FACS189425_02330 [Clostridia bacterium]GHV36479.1 hypothetical protein FACS18949_15930 [Clostridia bacterium]